MAELGAELQGRYRLDQRIGRGGFANVYLATDLRLERPVAVKVLDPALIDDEAFLIRFGREARAVASLDHPHILSVHDYGEDAGIAFLVMPYVAGGTLHELLLRQGKMPQTTIPPILAQIASALDYAHERGIIHRDVKPQNVLMRDGQRVLLADFGIAKALGGTGGQTNTAAMGTIAYMAPEQFDGEVSRATDIYALGCILFELLTGQPPYVGTAQQVLRGHMLAPVPDLAERLPGPVPPAVQVTVDQALAKDPKARFSSASELARAFAESIAGVTNDSGRDDSIENAVLASPHDRPTVANVARGHDTVVAPPPRTRGREPSPRLVWIVGVSVAVLFAAVFAISFISSTSRLTNSSSATTTMTIANLGVAQAPTTITSPLTATVVSTATSPSSTLTAAAIPTRAPFFAGSGPTATVAVPTMTPPRMPTPSATALVVGSAAYRDPQGRFALTVPNSWTRVNAEGAEVAYQSPAPSGTIPATVNVVVERLPASNVTLEEYDQAGEANLKRQFSDYRTVSLSTVTIGGRPAYKRIYTATIAGRVLQLQQVYLIERDVAYAISFGAPQETFAANAATFDQIAATFVIP